MAHRHLMAVCVVCLLCAEHMPCKAHLMVPNDDSTNEVGSLQNLPSENVGVLTKPADIPGTYFYDKRKDKTKDEDLPVLARRKRHADHSHEQHHHTETPEVTKNYIKKLFNRFSNENTNSMDAEQFQKMMLELELKHLASEQVTSINNTTCMSGESFLEKMTGIERDSDHGHQHGDDEEGHDNGDEHLTFLERIKIETDHMLAICPILLYQIVNRQSPLEASGCVNESNFVLSNLIVEPIEMESRGKVWLYSTLAIIGVSLCGLLGVAVIPIMEKRYYHQVLQFLVALAVGTLTGDALLHLMPHAMMPLYEGQDLHQTMMLRGLAAVGGIVFFYFFERFITIVTEMRQKKQKRDKPTSRVRVMRDPESVSLNNGIATCKHKYSSYPYCYDEIAMETKDDHHEHQNLGSAIVINHFDKPSSNEVRVLSPTDGKKSNGTAADHTIDTDNNTLSTSIDEASVESIALSNNNKLSHGNPVSKALKLEKDSVHEENYTIILREHQSKHHGHSHTHGHVHSPPGSLSAVVWMVIMGDGLHNFTDGMAIGAAFSNNIAGGLSTAVAVFCHELPHELGDFAVLLKAGMSAKQAVYYNILSSVLSFFGMCVGILIGDTPEASQWIFAVAAGLFIYIALVDMMPELTSSHGKEEYFMFTQIFLQFFGMCCGFATMLLIAIYEHDLKLIFAS